MKRIFVLVLAAFIFSAVSFVAAEDSESVYESLYKDSDVSSLEDGLSEEIADIINELGIDLSSYQSFLELSPKTFWNVVLDMLGGNITAPLTAFSLALSIILITSVISGMWSTPLEMNENYSYICLLSLSTVVLLPMISAVENCISGVKAICGFMLTFVPVYGGLLISSGGISSGVIYQSVMLGICEIVSQVAGFVIAPFIGIFISIGMASAISGIDGTYRLAMIIKNIANWILGLIMTFFTGFLSIQGVVGKSADSLAIKTTRFFVGSTVPVVGGYLSEALTTVTAGIGILRSTAAAWCILVLTLMVLPITVELLLWRICLGALSAVSEMFSVPEASKLFQICSVALGFLVAIILTVSVMFILSLVILKIGV